MVRRSNDTAQRFQQCIPEASLGAEATIYLMSYSLGRCIQEGWVAKREHFVETTTQEAEGASAFQVEKREV
jgi:hypothetical protein